MRGVAVRGDDDGRRTTEAVCVERYSDVGRARRASDRVAWVVTPGSGTTHTTDDDGDGDGGGW